MTLGCLPVEMFFVMTRKLADKIGYLTTEMKKNGKAVCLMACSVDEEKPDEKNS